MADDARKRPHEPRDQKAGQASKSAEVSQKQRSAGQLAAGTPPAVERASVQRSFGRQAAAPPPAAPQTRGRKPD